MGILNRVYVPIEEEELPVFKLGDSVVVNLNSACVEKEGQEISLTAKEHSLLLKLYENKGRIVTNDSLCQAIWEMICMDMKIPLWFMLEGLERR